MCVYCIVLVRVLFVAFEMGLLVVGRLSGVAVGVVFVGFGSGSEGGLGAIVRLQVVCVGVRHSSARIVEIRAPQLIRPGLVVLLDRKMP
jgi:hypothetical protein